MLFDALPKEPEFRLREHVNAADRAPLFDLVSSGGFFYPNEMAYGMSLFDEHLMKGENSAYQFMLYEQEGRLIGCGCFGLLPLTDRRYHLHWFVVSTAYHGHGVGQKLEAAIIARVRLQGGVKIYAEISNRPFHSRARSFLELANYRQAATVPNYYGDRNDKILYVKDL